MGKKRHVKLNQVVMLAPKKCSPGYNGISENTSMIPKTYWKYTILYGPQSASTHGLYHSSKTSSDTLCIKKFKKNHVPTILGHQWLVLAEHLNLPASRILLLIESFLRIFRGFSFHAWLCMQINYTWTSKRFPMKIHCL